MILMHIRRCLRIFFNLFPGGSHVTQLILEPTEPHNNIYIAVRTCACGAPLFANPLGVYAQYKR